MRQPCVYLLCSKRYGTLYVGVTAYLAARLEQHELKADPHAFTARYGAHRLVWWEAHPTMPAAIAREKRIKKYPRQWKINLIESCNPEWARMCPESGALLAG